MKARRDIGLSTLTMAFATLCSRIAGLVRDVMIARVFGAGIVTDAFFVAFTIPNLLRRFFAEGSLTAAFVPTFSEVYHSRGEKEAQELANRCVTLLLLVMIVVVAAGIILSPWVTKGIGYGFADVPGKLQLTDQLNKIMFPYIGFVSILALLTGILNVRGHFFLPSLSPLFLNLMMILSALTLGHYFSRPIYALAVGVLLGGGVQLLLQYPMLLRYNIRLRFDFRLRHDARLRKIMLLMLPGLVGVAIYQINIIVSRLLASFLPDGNVSYLYYGQRLFEFPQGIFVVSLAQAVLPMMSQQVGERDLEGMRDSLSFALSLISLFTLPAIVGLVLCSKPIYSLFFYGGEFAVDDLINTAWALVCYAPGLLFVGYSRIASQTFYALKDTRTPVIVSFWTLLVNLVAGLLLMKPFGFMGLAGALTLSSVFNAVFLVVLLQKRVGAFLHKTFWVPIVKIIPCCLLMAVTVFGVLRLGDWLVPGHQFEKSIILGGAVAAGIMIYLGSCYLLRIEEVKAGMNLLLRRRRRAG